MQPILGIIQSVLSEKYNADIEIKSEVSLGGGCINNASRLETSAGMFFLKWNSHCTPDVFIREAEGLQELRKVDNPFLKIPEVILARKAGSEPGFILLEYLYPPSSGHADDKNLGRGLATIHLYSSEQYGFYHDNYCGTTSQMNRWNSDWVDFFGQQRLQYLITLLNDRGDFSPTELTLFEKLIRKLPELIPDETSPSLIHGDLWSGNYMHTSSGPALIDPAVYYADREMEMGIMTMFGGFSGRFWDGYSEIYPLRPDWEDRNQLYQLYHILNHYYLFGGGYRQQAVSVARRYV